MGKVKEIIKALIPIGVFSLYKKYKLKKVKPEVLPEVFSGNYSSWSEVRKVCTGYENSDILEMCRASMTKVKNGEAVYERDSMIFSEIQYSWGLLAGLQQVALDNEGSLCVLDFGGSLGTTYYQNKTFLKLVRELKWCVVEQKNFVRCGKENFEDEQLRFFYSVEECMKSFRPDILLLSGVLQYLEKPYERIAYFAGLNIPYIIIDRTSIVNFDKDILTLQRVPEEIYHASYPSWFFNKENLLHAFNKYEVMASFNSICDGSVILNSAYPASWEGFILKKRDALKQKLK